MKQIEQETKQKLRGGYYTPEPIVDYLVKWALHGGVKTILEPSCGDGRFIKKIADLANNKIGSNIAVHGVEIIPEEAEKAEAIAIKENRKNLFIKIITDDYFKWITSISTPQKWDAIVGNPPYIRYQYFNKEQREIAESIFKRSGIPFTKRTNAWVPFVISAIQHLNPGGRLAMIIPSEILHIQHASGLRYFLEQEMEVITLLPFREIVFSDTLQGTLLLLCVKRNNVTNINKDSQNDRFDKPNNQATKTSLYIRDIDGVIDLPKIESISTKYDRNSQFFDGDWMKALLSPEEIDLLNRIVEMPQVYTFKEIANVQIGIVTGANNFFVVNKDIVRDYSLENITLPMLARSNLIDGIVYTENDHAKNTAQGKSVFFLDFPIKPFETLPKKTQEYIKFGENSNLHLRYKCRIRDPWYKVPYVWASEISMLKRCHQYSRLVLNDLGAYSTDTAYRITLNDEFSNKQKGIVFGFLNSFTFLLAEIYGRHYGGGVLELVPSEIDRLSIPILSFTDNEFYEVDKKIRNGIDVEELKIFTDEIILRKGLGLSTNDIDILQRTHTRYMNRRLRKKNK